MGFMRNLRDFNEFASLRRGGGLDLNIENKELLKGNEKNVIKRKFCSKTFRSYWPQFDLIF